MPGACAVIMSSILPHALLRSGPAGMTAALAIASLMAGTLSCVQLELFWGMMFLPLNTASSTACGSLKSLNQPTLGQMAIFCAGTLQNFVYRVSCGTARNLILKPSFSNCACATSAVFLPGSALEATISSGVESVHLPAALIGRLGSSFLAASMYFLASAM